MGIEETLQQIFTVPKDFEESPSGPVMLENVLTYTHYVQSDYVPALQQFLEKNPPPGGCSFYVDSEQIAYSSGRIFSRATSFQEVSIAIPFSLDRDFLEWLNQHQKALFKIASGREAPRAR